MTRKKKSKGLGDTIEKITEATGIKAVVKSIFGEDCGCDERKEMLNKLFPYRKPNCLNENEFEYLDKMFKSKKTRWDTKEQLEVLAIYNRILNDNKQPSNCNPCWKSIINDLDSIYKEYLTK